jgi:hypothetical protein
VVFIYGVIILGGSINTKKKTTEALIVASKEKELEINAEKTMCIVLSCARASFLLQTSYV